MTQIRRCIGPVMRIKARPRRIYMTVLASLATSAQSVTIVSPSTTGITLSSDTAYQLEAGSTVATATGDAIAVQGIAPATFSNAGSILGSTDGHASGIRFDVPGSFTNEGTGLVHGTTFGVLMTGGGSGNNVVNHGDISVLASHAIYYDTNTSGTVDNYGTLNNGTAGLVNSSADGVYVHTTGNVTINNHEGAVIKTGVNNTNYSFGVIVELGNVVINNDGLIDGFAGGIRSTTDNPIQIANSATGTIRGNAGPGVQVAHDGVISNNGLVASVNGPAILLAGANNRVILGAGSRLDGGKNVAISSQGAGNTILLEGSGNEDGDFIATQGNGFATLTAATGGDWTLTGNASMNGSAAATVSVAGSLTLGGTVTIEGGGGTTVGSGGRLTLGTGGAGGMVTGNFANDGTIVARRSDNFQIAGILSGAGTLVQAGSGITALTGVGSTQGAVSVEAGALLFAQNGSFTATGDYTTAAGATTAISGKSTLVVGNRFTTNGTLDVAVGSNKQDITASTATIGPGATFNLIGYTAAATASVSDLASSAFTVIHATTANGLSGTFQTVKLGGTASTADYLTLTSTYTPQNFVVGLGLTWYAAHSTSPQTAAGTFTLASAADSFELDAVLVDQAPNAVTGWDGRTLTKAGPGTLQLSKASRYTGATLIEGGTLLAGVDNAVAMSERVSVNAGATLDLNGFDQTVNNLSGAGTIALGSATLTVNHAADGVFDGVIGGTGGLAKTGAGSLTLTRDQTYGGNTAVNAGALILDNGARLLHTAQVTVAQGATLGGYGGVGGTVINHGVLAVADAAPGFSSRPAGGFVVGGSLVNYGEIRMGSPVPSSSLTVNGNYTGNDGRMTLFTALGDDASATDRLVVHGNTAGQTSVSIRNAGGPGARTVNGIRIVQVDGQSDGLFMLDGRVVAGAYEYSLYKGGVSSPDDGDWYLRSLSTEPTQVPRPETGAYLANQLVAQAMFAHTYHDRAGLPDALGADGRVSAISNGWARISGGHADGNAAGGNISESADTFVMQAGIDLLHRVSAWGQWQAGVMAGYGTSTTHANARGNPAIARGTVNGVAAGIYGTWHGNPERTDGPYADTWVQYGNFDNTVKGNGLAGENYASQVWSGSLEAGWAIPLGNTGNGVVHVEPQLQLIYTDYRSGRHAEANGTVVESQGSGGLATRLGARLFHVPNAGAAPAWWPYVEHNWWHNSRGNSITFDNVAVAQDGPRNRVETKVGAQAQIGRHWRMWGNIAYQYGNGGYESITGLLGVRYMW